jgi:hypothetical protein
VRQHVPLSCHSNEAERPVASLHHSCLANPATPAVHTSLADQATAFVSAFQSLPKCTLLHRSGYMHRAVNSLRFLSVHTGDKVRLHNRGQADLFDLRAGRSSFLPTLITRLSLRSSITAKDHRTRTLRGKGFSSLVYHSSRLLDRFSAKKYRPRASTWALHRPHTFGAVVLLHITGQASTDTGMVPLKVRRRARHRYW